MNNNNKSMTATLISSVLLALATVEMTYAMSTTSVSTQPQTTETQPAAAAFYNRVEAEKYWNVTGNLVNCPLKNIVDYDCKTCKMYPEFKEYMVAFNTKPDEEQGKLGQQGFVTYDQENNEIIIAFRGSKVAGNYFTDANILLVEPDNLDCSKHPVLKPCKIHKGFKNSWQELKPLLMPALNDLVEAHKDATITIVGHSLGGAIATIAAVELKGSENLNVSKIYTYGQPKVGNQEYQQYIQKLFYDEQPNNPAIFRIVNQKDTVPHLPPSNIPIGKNYIHAANEIWYESEESYYPNTSTATGDGAYVANGSGVDPDGMLSLEITGQKLDVAFHTNYFNIQSGCN